MKRYYTFRNPFYPSFKTLRKKVIKKRYEQERFERNMKIIGLLFIGIASVISDYDQTKSH